MMSDIIVIVMEYVNNNCSLWRTNLQPVRLTFTFFIIVINVLCANLVSGVLKCVRATVLQSFKKY